MNQLIKTDLIISTVTHVVNADDPKYYAWLKHNERGVKARIPGFLIKKPDCLVNEQSNENLVKVLGMGHINLVIREAFLYYEYLEEKGYVNRIANKMCPIVTFDMPNKLNPSSDLCTVSSSFDTVGVVVTRQPWEVVRNSGY